MDPELIERSLNFHGDDLLRTMAKNRNVNILSAVDPRQVSYFEYHKRMKDPKLEDDSKRSVILSFISEKASLLFKKPKEKLSMMQLGTDVEDYYAIMPPLEAFMGVPEKERHKHFLECLKKGDIVIGVIHAKQTIGLIVKLICLDGGKIREIYDLDIKALCPISQALTVSAHENPLDTYQTKDLIRCVVLDVAPEDEKIIISMKNDSFPNQTKLKLGLISEENIPSHFKLTTRLHGALYENILEQSIGFKNPGNVSYLCDMMGLLRNRPSLMTGLHEKEFPKEEYAVSLRKAQAAKWALRSVADGIGHFKAGRHAEAFQCLNKALQIDPENVEARVARGALFANNCNFSRALEDFEQAMEINPKHHNARKYMVETLVALGRQYEDKHDLKNAFKLYYKALKINPEHKEANEAIQLLEDREKMKMNKMRSEKEIQIAPSSSSKKDVEESASNITREKLKQLLKEDKRKEKSKKRVHSSTSSSSSSTSSSSSSSRSSSPRTRSRKRSYSPTKHDYYKSPDTYKSSDKSACDQIQRDQYKRCEVKGFKSTLREVKYENLYAGEKNKVSGLARDEAYSKDLNKLRAQQGKLIYEENTSRGKAREGGEKVSYQRNEDLMDFAEKMSKDKGKDFAREFQHKSTGNKSSEPSGSNYELEDLEARLNSYYQKFDSLTPHSRLSKEENKTFTKLSSKEMKIKNKECEMTARCSSPKVTFVMKPDQLERIGKKYLGKIPKEEDEMDADLNEQTIKEETVSPEYTGKHFKPIKIGEKRVLPQSNVFASSSDKKMDEKMPSKKSADETSSKTKPRNKNDGNYRSSYRSYRSRSRSRSRSRHSRSRSRSRSRNRHYSRRRSRSSSRHSRRSHSRSRSRSSRSRTYSRDRYSSSYSSRSRSRSYDSYSHRHRRSRSHSHYRSKSRSPYRHRSRSRSSDHYKSSLKYPSKRSYPRQRSRPYQRGGSSDRRSSDGRPLFRGRGRGIWIPKPSMRGRGRGRGRGRSNHSSPIVTRAVVPYYKEVAMKGGEVKVDEDKDDGGKGKEEDVKEVQENLEDEKGVAPFDNLEEVENMLKQHKAQKKAEILATNKDIKKKALW